jgi:hypothetical protein
MKKYFLIPIILIACICSASIAHASDRDTVFNSCLQQKGITSSQFYSPNTSVEGNPVEFFEKYIGVLHCFVDGFGRADNGPGFMQISYASKIRSFGIITGFNFNKFREPHSTECQKKGVACNKAHWDDGYDCTGNVSYPCQIKAEISTENALVASIRKYALSLPMPHEEPKEPECGPSEYLVSGKCQHIFELCGRDSLFRYNLSTGVCSCPDTYLPMDGKCMSEYDLDPPDLIHTPPPGDEPPPSPPDVIEPPVEDESGNAFCQPPDAQPLSYNEYGIPIANAQIYSNYSVLTHVKGDVLIWTTSTKKWAPAYKGQRMTIGDKIKTGRNGYAETKFANSAIFKMRPLSQLEIPDHKDGCSCHINHKVGYLDMKFGKVWSKVKPANDKCGWSVKTPTAIAGGTDRYDPDLARGYVNYESEDLSSKRTFKNLWNDIINNFTSDDAPSNDYEHYRQPQSYNNNDMSKVAFDVIDIKKALAEDGEIILHSMHDASTNTSRFYVEQGAVEVKDINETAGVVIGPGETIHITPDTVPHDMDVQPVNQVDDVEWENWDDDSGISIFILIILYIAGMVYVIRYVFKSKRGIFAKIGMFVLGFILMNLIVNILMLFM